MTTIAIDDDLTFDTSVWGNNASPIDLPDSKPSVTVSTATPPAVPSAPDSELDDSGFDDFDDFNTAPTSAIEVKDDDDFGDFEEFEGGDQISTGFDIPQPVPSTSYHWRALKLDPLPESSQLEQQVNELLEPIWADKDISQLTTDEGIREMEGIAQILVTPESREMYKVLSQMPTIKPLDWTRSRIRRQHLIALGIPVNLDEMLPRANGKPLPPLEIVTRPQSAPPSRASTSAHSSRPATPQLTRRNGPTKSILPRPELDRDKIDALLNINLENLNMQPLPTLERYLEDFKAQTANTSNLLTYLLQARDALKQDAETYHGLIGEMVGEAQKQKSGKARTAAIRRSGAV